jgi:DNA-directed RNA polymerase subunit H (RpoH/RPB5)
MASQNSSLISKICKSRITILQLLNSRGYNTNDYEGFSINEVNTMKNNNQLDMIVEKPESKVYIKYYLNKTIKPNDLRNIIDDLFITEQILTKNDTLYIITHNKANDTMIQELKHIWESEKIFIVIQPLICLQFNIMNHIYVPPFRVLNDAEKIVVLEKYNLVSNQMPEISRFDPVARALCIRPDEVCEIKRPSKTSVESLYYRICVQ